MERWTKNVNLNFGAWKGKDVGFKVIVHVEWLQNEALRRVGGRGTNNKTWNG